jgi:hypothetical protein
MALKSLVNDEAEMLGAAEPEEEVELEAEAPELALELLEELLLPHPAATAATARVTTDTRNQPKLITARSSHRRAKGHTDRLFLAGDTGRNTLSNGKSGVHRN